MGLHVCKLAHSGVIRHSSLRTSRLSFVWNGSVRSITDWKQNHFQQQEESFLSHRLVLPHIRQFYSASLIMDVHIKARCKVYPRTTDVNRFDVPDHKVKWEDEFPEYAPVDFTSKTVAGQPVWADPVDPCGLPFNAIDKVTSKKPIDRTSYEGPYEIVNGYPRNPRGRTGMTSRGSLGRWGPNHAADPIVTRWKRDENNKIVMGTDDKPILQFVAVERKDCGEWALPGGMVDPGENQTMTLKREFGEEAMNSFEASDEEKERIKKDIETFFDKGTTVYKGYVDDPRNTDNCWMETKAINFHDESGDGLGNFNLEAGDDAANVQWMDIDRNLKLYASHIEFIKTTVDLRKAHW